MKKIITLVSCLISFSCLFSRGWKGDDTIAFRDSLMRKVEHLPADTSRLSVLLDAAYLHQNPPYNVFFAKCLYEEARKQQNIYYENLGAYYLAVCYDKKHDLDSITLWVDELQELASKIGKYDYYLEQKAAISRVLASKKMNEKAAFVAKEVLKEAQERKSNNGIVAVKPKYMQIVQEKYGFKDWDSILAALGHGGLKEGQIVNRLAEEYSKDHRKELTDESVLEKVAEAAKNKVHITRSKSGIVVKGIDDMAVRFSRCCNPVPGDEIVGFITRGRGMSIHRTDCVNIIHLSETERARLIPAEWEKPEEGTDTGSYLAEIKMYANDRQGLLMDMSKVFTEMNIDVKSMNVRTSKQGTATIEAGFIVRGREELGKVIGKLRQIVGVLDIERAVG